MSSAPSYGQSLPDQVDTLASLSDTQLELLSDVRDLYRERVAIEREYATKLQLLAKKAADKKAKKIVALVVGHEPAKPAQDSAIQSSTLNRAYSQLVSSIGEAGQDHMNLADSLNTQVVEALKTTEKRHDDAKKRQMQYFQKLLSERDKAYNDRLKTKQKYDEECSEVETYRQKQERSTDDKHAERAAKQFEQQQIDMLNSKNVYLIATVVANRTKAKFYGEDLPVLEDQFQLLHTQLLRKFADIVIQAQTLESHYLDVLKAHVTQTETAFQEVDPTKDQETFIDHNVIQFSAPSDWTFEPCAVHYDTSDMSVEPAPKVYLQNRLAKCKQKLQELEPVMKVKRQEVEQASKLVSTYTEKPTLGNVEEVSDAYLDAQHELSFYAISEAVLRAEIETISAALGGDEGAQSPHTFKSSSFSIPTQCAYCKSSIWGLSKQGKTCKACGISVHAKCELKVPANCGAPKGGHGHHSHLSISSSLSRSRSDSRASSASTVSTAAPSSFVPPDRASVLSEETHPSARIIFEFTQTSPFELSVQEGSVVHIVEEDDGSGWVKVMDEAGAKGLVPASYLEFVDPSEAAQSAPLAPARGRTQQASKKSVRGIYDYTPQGPDEIAVEEGQLIELTAGPNGGQNYADGWWEGLDASGKKGIFPSNYVELVP
ncbi:uncharacterized protein PHACADRAFT_212588 [Phanerochaete carnosa HHB-10118-sp]|uniref:FCH-domain-containing protein n=1 Tax=Phanerochaete carnosa (strain HHB-10118-sp) TaxID=650164 RepID=K5VYS6_PHACS|nr:uncharacterized protein PHACADRAFT_212588 [Phanerochaete carnosa HHB-10118-sp]EKM51975.1 hypothetical protein PHACADRAFT_212588 [Phanerochaete carnosa HHB-10118-sp]